ncbi:MAG: hypothetical protein K0S71_1539 [Clostridia bacterium]|jgi:two-component system sensor histidine kinase YesM|nr:hypothetical protein [Clostridia bacterium]
MKLTFSKKILLSYLLILLLPFCIIVTIVSTYIMSFNKKMIINQCEGISEQVILNIDTNMKQIEQLTNTIYSRTDNDKRIIDYLDPNKNTSSIEKLKIDKLFTALFIEMSYYRNDMSAIYTAGKNGAEYFYYKNSFNGSGYQPDSRFIKKIGKNKKTYFFGTHKQFDLDTGIEVFTIAKLITNFDTQEPIANIIVDFNLQAINNLASKVSLGLDEEFLIVTRSNEMIYSNKRDYVNTALDESLFELINSSNKKTANINYKGNKYLLIKNFEENDNVIVAFLINQNKIMNKAMFLPWLAVLISAAALAICWQLSRYFSKKIYEPTSTLIEGMDKIKNGEFGTQINCGGYAEMNLVASGFNEMSQQIKTLIDSKYILEIHTKDARLKALISQINPHFIYNTLEIISGQAMAANCPQVSSTITALGQMLHYTIKTGSDVVTLKEELNHLKNFLFIKEQRINKKIDISYSIPKAYLSNRILKLTLQPLVENCIQYASKDRDIKISLEVTEENDIMNIIISDNGMGISTEKLKYIIDGFNTVSEVGRFEELSSESIGLFNVNARQVLCFGKDYQLVIDTAENSGTKITIRVPQK